MSLIYKKNKKVNIWSPKAEREKTVLFFFFFFFKVLFIYLFLKVVLVKLLNNSPNKVGHILT